MCKLTILHYSQCNCGPRDGSYEDGFIITKSWHNRLPLDLDRVPFQRCTEARNFALCPSQSNTMEFSRCQEIQIENIQFQAEPCFRCFTRREILKRTEQIKALNEKRKILAERFDASQRVDAQDAEFTKNMRQTMKASPRFDRRTEKQRFHGTKAELSSVKFGPVMEMVPDWEDGLRKQLASHKLAQGRSTVEQAEDASSQTKEKEETRKQAKLALLQHRLARVNMHAAFSVPVEEGKPPIREHDSHNQDNPIQRLRVARSTCKLPSEVELSPDVTVPVKAVHNDSSNGFASLGSSSARGFTPHAQRNQNSENTPVKYHTINGGAATKASSWIEDERAGANSSPRVELSSYRSLMVAAARAPEFKPFQRPPPTEPLLMRAPTAPRAAREASNGQMAWQSSRTHPSFRKHATYRTWRG